MTTIVSERHIKTGLKAIVYRICSILAAVAIALIFGAGVEQAASLGAAVLITGSVVYYLHDRVWLLTPWGRDNNGIDNNSRTIIKMIVYRILIYFVSILTVQFTLQQSAEQAAVTSFVILIVNSLLYFAVEKFFGRIEWGKVYKN